MTLRRGFKTEANWLARTFEKIWGSRRICRFVPGSSPSAWDFL